MQEIRDTSSQEIALGNNKNMMPWPGKKTMAYRNVVCSVSLFGSQVISLVCKKQPSCFTARVLLTCPWWKHYVRHCLFCPEELPVPVGSASPGRSPYLKITCHHQHKKNNECTKSLFISHMSQSMFILHTVQTSTLKEA